MSPRDEIAGAAANLRAAVAAGSFGHADRLLAAYCRRVEEVLRAQPDAQAENAQIAAAATDLFQWMRRTVLTAAAHDGARLSGLSAPRAYIPAPEHAPTWKLDV